LEDGDVAAAVVLETVDYVDEEVFSEREDFMVVI
jgi:hypothetical protein